MARCNSVGPSRRNSSYSDVVSTGRANGRFTVTDPDAGSYAVTRRTSPAFAPAVTWSQAPVHRSSEAPESCSSAGSASATVDPPPATPMTVRIMRAATARRSSARVTLMRRTAESGA